jgi:hypothetical protein
MIGREHRYASLPCIVVGPPAGLGFRGEALFVRKWGSVFTLGMHYLWQLLLLSWIVTLIAKEAWNIIVHEREAMP